MNPSLLHILHQTLFGGVAAVGFAVLFNVRPSMLPLCFVSGMLALAIRTTAQESHFTLPVASFFACLGVAIVDNFTRDVRAPRGSVLAVVGAIPMVPGGVAAKVLIGVFAVLRAGPPLRAEDLTANWQNLMTLIFTLGAMGTALALPSLVRPIPPPGEPAH